MTGADLGREFTDQQIEAALRTARVPFERPEDLAGTVADVLAADGVVAWVQGRSEYGPRALGHRSLLAHPGRPMVDDIRDALECSGATPVDLLAIGPFVVRR
jgi:carbamoyltransferase